jgi:hypothetical protein
MLKNQYENSATNTYDIAGEKLIVAITLLPGTGNTISR